MEFIWKFCASIVKNGLRSTITLHEGLHRFRWGEGATMEANLDQQLAWFFMSLYYSCSWMCAKPVTHWIEEGTWGYWGVVA